MEDPSNGMARDDTGTAKSEALLTELFGPLADRVRDKGPKSAYLSLLASSVFLRHRAQSSWADLREEVREALDAQSAPEGLLRAIGHRADATLQEHGLSPGISIALGDLCGDAVDDVAHVIRLCEDLRPEDFSALLDRFGAWTGPGDESFFTPRPVIDLVAEILSGDCKGAIRIHDPYIRGGELLAGALGAAGGMTVSGASPSADMLRLAGMNLLLSGRQANLSSGNTAPWNQSTTLQADLILTNPPFNDKGSPAVRSRDESWIFGPPGGDQNYAWLQYVIVSLNRAGKAIVLMPNQAAVSPDGRKYSIRQKMIQEGAVEFMVALPRQLFAATTVPAMIWGLRSPTERPGSVLFIDIRRAGSRQGKRRVLDLAEIRAVADCLRSWRAGAEDFASNIHGIGHATAASIEEIESRDFSLDPSDYLSRHLLDLDPKALDAIPEIATAVELGVQHAQIANKRAAGIVIKEGMNPQRHWRRTQIGSLCIMKTGPSHSLVKQAIRVGDGVPLIVPRCLRGHRIVVGESERITAEAARAMERFQLREKDILFVRTGSVGPVALVTAAEDRWLFGTNLIRLRCHEDVDPGYLLAFLSSRPAQRWIRARTESATAIPSISAESLGKLPVNLPPLDEQRRVSDLLAKLDMQITTHRTVADTATDLRTLLADGLTGGLLIAN